MTLRCLAASLIVRILERLPQTAAALVRLLSKEGNGYTIKFSWADFPFFVIFKLQMSRE